MKRLANYLMALALMAFTFTSCEDVPNPFGQILPPGGEEEAVVVDPTGSGTLADPYNVTRIVEIVNAYEDNAESSTDVYIKGIVKSIKEQYGTQYGNATFDIQDVENGEASFTIYRALYLGNAKYADDTATKLSEGDEVIICGKVTKYVNASSGQVTLETKQNLAYLYSLNGTTGGDTPTPTETLGTKDAPITVAKALEYINALADNGTTEQDAYVTGKITKIKTKDADIAKYKNIDYIISDGTNELTVFRGKNIDNTDFTEAGQINVGDEVVVFGKLTKYVNNGTTTPEVAQGNYIVKLTKGSGGGDTPAGLGTQDAPITVAQALNAINALADGGETETEAFVKGKISKVQSFNDKYKSITYYISDDGKEANELQIYSGKNIGSADFAAATDLTAGDEVVVKGKLKKFMKNGEAIPEMNQPNEIITITKGAGGGGNTGATSLDVDFKTNGQGDWTIANVKALPEGVSYIWSYDSKYGMKASAYVSGTRYETDNWLVSPTISLTNGGTMTFKQALNYATNEYVKVMYTTTNGSGDVKSSEWQEATVDTWPAGNSWSFIESKATLPAGTVRVAFRYTSDSSKAATWEIETVSIK